MMLRLALTHVESGAIAGEALLLIHTQPRARQISYSGSGDRCTSKRRCLATLMATALWSRRGEVGYRARKRIKPRSASALSPSIEWSRNAAVIWLEPPRRLSVGRSLFRLKNF